MHRVRPELVAEVTYLTWREDNLCDKPAKQVVRAIPVPQCP